MMLTENQFDALDSWLQAEIRAALSRRSAGPHVRPERDAANAAALQARLALTGNISEEAQQALSRYAETGRMTGRMTGR